MYSSIRRRGAVREARDAYAPSPADAELLSGRAALRDLAAADDAAVPRILARFAVLRFWLLRATTSPPVLLDPARVSALAYLEPTIGGWREGRLLRRLMDRPEPFGIAALRLRAAARLAAADGHDGSAFALRGAAYIGALAAFDHAAAATLASEIAAQLEGDGEAGGGSLWRGRAAQARAAAALWVPPSTS